MKRMMSIAAVALMLPAFVLSAGCAQKAASSSDAVQHAKTLKTPEEQANYLLGQAKAFLNSKEYAEAQKTAQYVIAHFSDKASEAQAILARAGEQLAKDMQGAAGDAKKKLGL